MIFTARKATEGPCDAVGLLTPVEPVAPPDLRKCEKLPSSNMQGRPREIEKEDKIESIGRHKSVVDSKNVNRELMLFLL